MYNKNGLFLINNFPSITTSDLIYSGVDAITFSDGTTNGSSPIYAYHAGSSLSGSAGALSYTRLLLTSLSNSYTYVTKPTVSYDYGAHFILGYRASAFTEETYDYPSEVSGLTINRTVTAGRVTIAAINNGNSNAVVNEIVAAVSGGTATGNAKADGIVIAGFHFPDVTIAPGESYTFTITHKNS